MRPSLEIPPKLHPTLEEPVPSRKIRLAAHKSASLFASEEMAMRLAKASRGSPRCCMLIREAEAAPSPTSHDGIQGIVLSHVYEAMGFAEAIAGRVVSSAVWASVVLPCLTEGVTRRGRTSLVSLALRHEQQSRRSVPLRRSRTGPSLGSSRWRWPADEQQAPVVGRLAASFPEKRL